MRPRQRSPALLTVLLAVGFVALGTLARTSGAAFFDTTSNAGNSLAAGQWVNLLDVSGGDGFTCVSDEHSGTWCWGEGSLGQLGDGNGTDSTNPVKVAGAGGTGELGTTQSLAAGEAFACGAKSDGSVWCWGRNDAGQLGNGTIVDSDYPVQVVGVGGVGTLGNIVDVAAGQQHACASDGAGNVYCWGEGSLGQLGDGTGTDSSTPVQTIDTAATGNARDEFTAGTFAGDDGTISWNASWSEIGESDGTGSGNVWVYSWAYCTSDSCLTVGSNGSSFDGKGALRSVNLTGYTSATLSWDFQQYQGSSQSGSIAMQVSSDGSSWNTLKTYTHSGAVTSPQYEEFSIDSYISATTSIRVIGTGTADAWFNFDNINIDADASGSAATSVAAGLDHSCAEVDGAAYCWGENGSGQVGDGTTIDRLSPVTVDGEGGVGTLTDIEALDGGDAHTCGSDSSGDMYCWGGNGNEQLGGGFDGGDGTAFYRASTVTQPIQTIYDAGSFGIGTKTLTLGEFRIIRSAVSPTRDEAIVVGLTGGNDIAGMMWSNGAWSALPFNNIVDNITYSYYWAFDVAYESQSGDLMLVYDNDTTGNQSASYRVWNGTSWTSPQTITLPVYEEALQLQLAADPTSDEMILAGSNYDSEDFAIVWNGSSWGNSIALDTNGYGDDLTDVSVAYEQQSGDALVVYGNNYDNLYFRTWTGSWGNSSSLMAPSGITGDVRWTTMGADPGSDRIVVGILTRNNEVWWVVWTGSSFYQSNISSTTANTQIAPQLAVAFEGTSGWAVATYAENGVTTPRYRTWSTAGWSGELSAPDIGAAPNSMMLYAREGSDEIMLAVQDDLEDLHYLEWSGSAWGSDNELYTYTGETKNQPFTFMWDFVPVDTTKSTAPLQVLGPGGSGTLANVAQIGLGGAHSCASLTTGAAYCWGQNDQGEVGDSTTTQRDTPTQVVGQGGVGTFDLAGFITGGDSEHTCAVRDVRQLWCWGNNTSGQFGDGGTSDSSTPVRNGRF